MAAAAQEPKADTRAAFNVNSINIREIIRLGNRGLCNNGFALKGGSCHSLVTESLLPETKRSTLVVLAIAVDGPSLGRPDMENTHTFMCNASPHVHVIGGSPCAKDPSYNGTPIGLAVGHYPIDGDAIPFFLPVVSCGSPGPQKPDVLLERDIAAFDKFPKHIKENLPATFPKERIFNEDAIFSVPSSQEGGIDTKVGSSTMHMPKHCSVSEGAPFNSSGYGDSKMYVLVMPQSLRAGDGVLPPKLSDFLWAKGGETFSDEITVDVIFSVASSQEGGIDIGVGSSTMLMQKHCSVHHPVVQMVLFAIKRVSEDPHSMVPKAILDIIEKASFCEGAPLNSSGYGEERRDSNIHALGLPQSSAGDGCSSSTGTLVPPLYLDSGAAHHVVNDNTILINVRDPPAGTRVIVADGSEHLVTKVGDIQTPDIKIKDVYHVPQLQVCLVSVSQLTERKIDITFSGNRVELLLEGRRIGDAIIDDAKLYRLRSLQAP